jgi:hypothetical protein
MVGHGVDAGDAPAYAAHNDLGTAVLLPALRHRQPARPAILCAMRRGPSCRVSRVRLRERGRNPLLRRLWCGVPHKR